MRGADRKVDSGGAAVSGCSRAGPDDVGVAFALAARHGALDDAARLGNLARTPLGSCSRARTLRGAAESVAAAAAGAVSRLSWTIRRERQSADGVSLSGRARSTRASGATAGESDEEEEEAAAGAGAVANAHAGEFSMLSAGTQVSVATRAGEVVLSARGRSVKIGSGQLSVVERDQPPTAPQPIPASLFLKLGAARPVVQRAKSTTVYGATTPGAIVSINGVRVNADAKGEFSTTVALKEGANNIAVESGDVLGRSEKAAWPRVTVDTSAPSAKTKVEW